MNSKNAARRIPAVTPTTKIASERRQNLRWSTRRKSAVDEKSPRDVDYYVTQIASLYRKRQDTERNRLQISLSIGRLLGEAKSKLRHGQYQHMVKALLPFDLRHARRFTAMAAHEILGKTDPGSVLPDSPRTRYELSRLPVPTLVELMSKGAVRPNMSRSEAAKLVVNEATQRHHATIAANARGHDLGGRRVVIGSGDVPWDAEINRADAIDPYPRMTVDEICNFRTDDGRPMKEVFADDAILYFWVIDRFLFCVPRIFAAWNFQFRNTMVWPKAAIGLGHFARSQHELVCIGTRGAFKPPETHRRHSTLIVEAATRDRMLNCASPHDARHSSKPNRLQQMIEAAYPQYFGRQSADEPLALELFARSWRPGWLEQGYEYPGVQPTEPEAN